MCKYSPQDDFSKLEKHKTLAPDVFRRRLIHCSKYRGIKEMDIIMSQFCRYVLPTLADDDLIHLDLLMRESDHDLYAWKNKFSTPPKAAFNNPLFQLYLDFELDFKSIEP